MTLPPVQPGAQPESHKPHRVAGDAGEASPSEPFEGLLRSLLEADRAARREASPGPQPGLQPEAAPAGQAKMFNQDGFFPEASPGGEGTGAQAARIEMEGQPPVLSRPAALPLSEDPGPRIELPASSRQPEPAAWRAAPEIRTTTSEPAVEAKIRPARLARPAAAAGDALATGSESEFSADMLAQDAETVTFGRRPASAPAERGGGTTHAQVVLQAAGAEASIVARVQTLSREERSRLRQEIAELLARYGLSPGEITLNGEAESVRTFMRESE